MSWFENLCAICIFLLSLDNRVATYWETAAHSAYNMFSKYLIVNLVFSHLGFWSGDFLLSFTFLLVAFS